MTKDQSGSKGGESAPFTPETFIAAVAEIRFHDDVGGEHALNYAVTNTLHGRGTLNKTTRRTVASAIRTLQAIIRHAQELQDASLAKALSSGGDL